MWSVLVAVSALVGAVPAIASPLDCPLARTRYSTRTPLIDILLHPQAKAVLDRVAPDLVVGFTKPFGGGAMPTGFSAKIDPAFLLQRRNDRAVPTKALDRELGRVSITPAATETRCARYDDLQPELPAVVRRPALLVFEKINGFRDGPSVEAAGVALKAIAARRGWAILFTDKGGVFNPNALARFDAVVWNNVSGDALTMSQRQAFKQWIEQGGGYVGVHGSGGDPIYLWDWYVDTLVGARFIGHPMAPQFQAARVVVGDRAGGIARGLPPEWTMTEEWYSFGTSPRARGAHILATLDEATYRPIGVGGQNLAMGNHPVAWTRCVGAGRSFYSAIGHRPENYAEPNSNRLMEQGIAWAMGLGDTRCAGGREITSKEKKP